MARRRNRSKTRRKKHVNLAQPLIELISNARLDAASRPQALLDSADSRSAKKSAATALLLPQRTSLFAPTALATRNLRALATRN